MTLNRVWIPSPNYSARNATVRLIVLHSSEGAQTYQSLGGFFANPASQVSSHVGVDDTPSTIGEYVRRDMKAWTAANANPVAVQAELCTPSGASQLWSRSDWLSHRTMLANTAEWIAEEAAHYNIPIVRLTPAQAQSNAAGVCQHSDLGRWGGGHVDCGPNFPIDDVINAALGNVAPKPPPIPEEPDMIAPPCTFTMDDVQQAFYIDVKGTLVHCYMPPGKPWVKENLGGGWDVDSGLAHDIGYGGSHQVWGWRADGNPAQMYWSGRAWTLQPLP